MAVKGLDEARRTWDAACRAWSKDDASDAIATMKLGEAMMYAATAFICALDDVREKGLLLAKALETYGYPVSDAHWRSAQDKMSVQARTLHLTARAFGAAIEILAEPECIHHPGARAITNLDGEDLCQDCANAWVRGEGDWQRYCEEEDADHG